jgi:hypothetical protein
MQQAMVRPPSHPETVYLWRYRRRMCWLPWIYPPLGTMNLILAGVHRSRSQLVESVVMFALTPLLLWSRRSVRLVVTPTSLTYHAGVASLSVPWGEMRYIGRSRQRLYGGWEGIFFGGQAAWRTPRWLPWHTFWRPRFIPLWSRWTGPYWDRELFDDLFHYAPWLAERPAEGWLRA